MTTMNAQTLYLIMGGGAFAVAALVLSAFAGGDSDMNRRLSRVAQGTTRKIMTHDRATPGSIKSRKDSSIGVIDTLVKLLPNPGKLRARLARTGRPINLGEYALMNALAVALIYMIIELVGWNKIIAVPLAAMVGLGLPHAVTGFMGDRRVKKFLATFPEAIDTMCRGIRSGLPITESIAAVGREMPAPIGTEFHRISDGVRMGKTLEAAMWEVAQRIDAPEFRFLIIAMAIQKETGGNLAETLGNLADLIRKRRQLRLKIKAMSSEAKASAMIIGSLPFIMFGLLMIVNSDYIMILFRHTGGRLLLGAGVTWMAIGWATMLKMISFEI
ncbi:MAG: type II secretion system F family protein [Alphaproteobacteria bacterium]|nr:type II secretion system F family protein [Alphaproteobacteria bacterium]